MSKKKWGLFLLLGRVGIAVLIIAVLLLSRLGVMQSTGLSVQILTVIRAIFILAGIPIGAILISNNYAKNKFVMKEISAHAWKRAKKKFVLYLYIFLTVILVYILFGRLFNLHTDDPSLNAFNNIVNLIIGTVFLIGFTDISLRVAEDKHAIYTYFYSKIKLFFHMLLARILIGIIVLIGFALLIIPGILLATRLQFFNFFIVEKSYGPIKALRESRRITKGYVAEIILYSLLLYCINLLGLICLGVGLFRTIPMTMIARATLYKKLEK